MTFLPPMRPHGRLRISEEALDGHPAYRRLLEDAAITRCCPVWIHEDGLRSIQFPDDVERSVAAVDHHDAAEVLRKQWPGSWLHADPFGAEFPGLAAPPQPDSDPIDAAVALAPRQAHLALVPVTRPADVLPAVRWAGTCNYYALDLGELASVMRSWEDRFGALLVEVGRSTLFVSVATPPWSEQECLGVAAEHFAFCCDVDGEDPRPLRQYAAGLRGSRTWRFWWD